MTNKANWSEWFFFRWRSNQGGSVLIIVLWSLFFLVIMALAIDAYVRPQVAFTTKLINRTKMYYFAKAGVKRAILEVEKGDKTDNYDALTDTWCDNDKAFKDVEIGDGTFSIVKDLSVVTSEQKSSEGASGSNYGLIDEERKINVNKAPYDVLKRLVETTAISSDDAETIASSIINWRLEADKPTLDKGADDAYYVGLNPGYHCKNAEFDVPEELLLIKGVSPEVFGKIKGEITVYTEGPININTADRTVLKCLGMEDELIDKIMHFRSGHSSDQTQEAKNAFKDIGAIAATLSNVETLSGSEIAMINKIFSQGLLTVKSDVFLGQSVGHMKNGADFTKIIFVYDRNKKSIRYWREE